MTSPDPTHSEKHLRQQAHRSFVYALEAGMKELTQALLAQMIRAEYSPDGPFPPHADELLAGAWERIFATQRNQWQPIDTAPKDGRWIIVTSPCWQTRCPAEESHALIVRWNANVDGWCHEFEEGGGGFVLSEQCHWMPLPEPPKPTKEINADTARVQYRGQTVEFVLTSKTLSFDDFHGIPTATMTLQGTGPGGLKLRVDLPIDLTDKET